MRNDRTGCTFGIMRDLSGEPTRPVYDLNNPRPINWALETLWLLVGVGVMLATLFV